MGSERVDSEMTPDERRDALLAPPQGLIYTCDYCGAPMLDDEAACVPASDFGFDDDEDWFVGKCCAV